MTAPLKIRTPGEIAALVPHLLGFQPGESLVALSLRGERHRLGLVLRADLGDPAAVAAQVVHAMTRDGAEAVALLVHTEEEPQGLTGEGVLPRAELAEHVAQALEREGTQVLEVLLVHRGRWWSYRCSRSCCPPEGTPVDTASAAVRDTEAYHVLEGRAVLGSRAELERSIAPALPLGPAVARAQQDAAMAALAAAATADRFGTRARELDRWRRARAAWEERPGPVAPPEAAALAVGLHLVPVRDAVTSWGADAPGGLQGLLGQLCQAVVPPDDAPLCTVTAWLAYAHGNGALALVALQRALATDPGYSMARLLLQAIDGVLPPESLRDVLRQAA